MFIIIIGRIMQLLFLVVFNRPADYCVNIYALK